MREKDSARGFSVVYPKDGGVATLPLRFQFHFDLYSLNGMDSFLTRYGDKLMCVEIENVATKCLSIRGASIVFKDLSLGAVVARAFISDGARRYREAEAISFTLVNAEDFAAHIDGVMEQTRVENKLPLDRNILQWAEQQAGVQGNDSKQRSRLESTDFTSDGGVSMVIGIKTAVLTNVARRQAIRETWANKVALPPNVKVFFLGCTPIMNDVSSGRDRERFHAAKELERDVYGDLLTAELDCLDARTFLAEKVSGFLEWLVANLPQTTFVMMADDDIYARVDRMQPS